VNFRSAAWAEPRVSAAAAALIKNSFFIKSSSRPMIGLLSEAELQFLRAKRSCNSKALWLASRGLRVPA
jgi:hypothetical protein